MRNASEITPFARTPMSRAVVKSCEAARMDRPARERRRKRFSAMSEIAPIVAVMIDRTLIRTGPICTALPRASGTGIPRARTDTACRNAPWISCATAKEVNRSDTKLAFRSGLNAISFP